MGTLLDPNIWGLIHSASREEMCGRLYISHSVYHHALLYLQYLQYLMEQEKNYVIDPESFMQLYG